MAESYLYPMTEAVFIADEIGRALNGDAWHGASLNELLEKAITPYHRRVAL